MPYDYIEEYQKQNDDTIWEFRDKDAQSKIDISSTETDYANPLTFETMQAQLAKNTKVKIEPIQDLHGYDKPWVGGAGKNICKLTLADIKATTQWSDGQWVGDTFVINTVTYSFATDNDGNIIKVIANGTKSTHSQSDLKIPVNLKSGVTYRATALKVAGSYSTFHANIAIAGSNNNIRDTNGVEITPNTDVSVVLELYIDNNYVANNVEFYPMVCLATATNPTTFEPYTNISSIKGYDKIDVNGCGKNLLNPAEKIVDSIYQLNYFKTNSYLFKGGNTYTIEYKGGDGDVRLYFAKLASEGGIYNMVTGIKASFTPEEDCYGFIQFTRTTEMGTLPSNTEYFLMHIGSSTESYSPYTPSTSLQIQLGETVYGGTLDVENGVLVVDKEIEDLGNLDWTYHSSSGIMYSTSLANTKKRGLDNFITSCYEVDAEAEWTSIKDKSCDGNSTYGTIYIKDSSYDNATTFKSAMSGQTICYELATPYTLHLTPHQLSLLKSQNTITTSQYTQIKVTYRNGVFATLEELSDLDTNVKDIIDKFNALGLSVVDGKLCQTYNT